MRGMLFAAAAIAIAASCADDKPRVESEPPRAIPSMTIDEVAVGLAANDLVPVDCNGEITRGKYGTLPRAILLADEETFTASDLPPDKSRKLVFYCWDDG